MPSELRVAFPESDPDNDITLSDGRVVNMRPVPLKFYPRLMSALVKMSNNVTKKQDKLHVALSDLNEDLMSLIEVSISVPFDTLSIVDGTDILDKFMEMNFPGEAWGKWMRLAQRQLGAPVSNEKAGASKKT